MKSSEVDKLLEFFDNPDLVKISAWAPTVQDLKDLDVEGNFEKYAKFLLYIQECILQYAGESSTFSNLTPQQLKETSSYINKLIIKNIDYSEE